jgi:hypothetical protein
MVTLKSVAAAGNEFASLPLPGEFLWMYKSSEPSGLYPVRNNARDDEPLRRSGPFLVGILS